MTRLIIVLFFASAFFCAPTFSAEPEVTSEAPDKPAGSTPKQEKASAPNKTEYDKLSYATLQQKADAGDLTAQFELGSRYNYGRDLPKNTRAALRWLRKAAQAGNQDAQRLLAVKLFEGHDIPVDQEEAFKWTQRLADSGDRAGQLMLGNLYANGEGTARNLIRAYMWFDIAATPISGKILDEPAKTAMQAAAEARDKTSSLLHPEEEVEAQQLASDWWLTKNSPSTATTSTRKKAGSTRKNNVPAKK